jgi:exopolysaccharide biosynthesis polyprenyl glycosylphosphotransferase
MTRVRRQFFVYLYSIFDLCLLGIALYLSIFGPAGLMSLSALANRTLQVHTIVAVAFLLFLWNTSFSMMGLYQSRRLSPAQPEFICLLKASAAATFLLAVVSLTFWVQTITPVVYLRFFFIVFWCLIASRTTTRGVLRVARRHGRNLRHLVVVGTNSRAVTFAENILARPELGYRLVGFVDDSWVGPQPQDGIPATLVSHIEGFREYVRSHIIDEVVIALPIKSYYHEADTLLRTCCEHGVIVRVMTSLFEESHGTTEVNELGSSAVVSFYTVPVDSIALTTKRIVDIVGSSLLLVLSSPLMLAAFILVKLDSKGPAIFAQERIGLNKRRFRIYKFRSMVTNAEKLQAQLESTNEAQGPVFKIKEDPRITRIGRLLRKTSVDELPQLLNVLKGDMSLVGPRPLPVRDYNGFDKDWQRRRFSVPPGLTCLWQVKGRSKISFDQWMRLDMEYIDRWSLWLDMKILAQTVPAVLRGYGAS